MPVILASNTQASMCACGMSGVMLCKGLQFSCLLGAVEWRFLLSGVALGTVASLPNPAPRWLTDKSWTQILNLSSLPAFQVDHTIFLIAISLH